MAAKDLWLERADAHRTEDVPDLFATLTDASRRAIARRLAALRHWSPRPELARGAGDLLLRFPFDERELDIGTLLLGLAILNDAPTDVFEHRPITRRSNELERWREPALIAGRTFLARSDPPPVHSISLPHALPLRPRASAQAAWLTLANSASPAALPLLLEHFKAAPATDVVYRCIALFSFSRDARIAAAAADLLDFPPILVRVENVLFLTLGLLLVVHGDDSHRPALARLVGTIPELEWVVALFDRRGSRPAADAAAGAARPAIPATVAGFDRWIAEAPDDLARRALFSDWLSERGDPRGEFIALSLASSREALSPLASRRMAALQKEYCRVWLRPLARCLSSQDPVGFRDGFLDEVRLRIDKYLPRPDEPLLATVTNLTVFGREDDKAKALLASERLANVRRLEARPVLVTALQPKAREKLVELSTTIEDLEDLDRLGALSLPELRTLRLELSALAASFPPRAFLELAWARTLHELAVGPTLALAPWSQAARESRLRILRVDLSSGFRVLFELASTSIVRVSRWQPVADEPMQPLEIPPALHQELEELGWTVATGGAEAGERSQPQRS